MPLHMAQASETLVQQITRAVARRAPPYVDAEDIAQEIRLTCWEAADAHRGGQGYFQTCGFRAGLQWIRTEAHLRGVTQRQFRAGISCGREVPLDAASALGRDGVAGQVASRAVVRQFLATLSDGERAVVRGRREGLTSGEIGAQIGSASSSVRCSLMRIRRKWITFQEGIL